MNEWTYAGYPSAGEYANAIVNGKVSDQQIAMNEYFSSPEGQIAGIVNKLQEQYRDYDNTWSAEQARIQRDWSAEEAEKNRMFNMAEAAKNREWQQEMSNTAHRREVNDLMAAGLNPVLSAMGGNGAAVGSGATAAGVGNPSGQAANGNQSAGMAVASMLGTILKNQTDLEMQRNNAELAHWQTERAAEVNELLTRISGDYAVRTSSISASAVLGAAQIAAEASKYHTDVGADTADKDRHSRDLNATLDRKMTREQNELNREQNWILTRIDQGIRQQGIDIDRATLEQKERYYANYFMQLGLDRASAKTIAEIYANATVEGSKNTSSAITDSAILRILGSVAGSILGMPPSMGQIGF